MRTLLVDNYDSFTYNIADLLAEVNGVGPVVVRNDVPFTSIDLAAFDNVVISPGPGHPTVSADFGISAQLIAETELPLLGVCLGHQGICAASGARVVRAPRPMHGRLSQIRHAGVGIFAGLPSPLPVVRYHSLVVDDRDLPPELEVLARSKDGAVMAVRHRTRPLWGVQFHPESIAAVHGAELLANFGALTRGHGGARSASPPVAVVRRPRATSRAAFTVAHRRVEGISEPAALFERLFAGRAGAFWLDGAAGAPGERYSVMGDATGPRAERVTYDVATKRVRIERESGIEYRCITSIFDYLKEQLTERSVGGDMPSLPFGFRLGYVGYLGYELKAETGGQPAHRSDHPDADLVFADRAVVIDHEQHCCHLLELRAVDGPAGSDDWLDRMTRELAPADAAPAVVRTFGSAPGVHIDADDYRRRIEHALDLIRAGDTYEVCLTAAANVPGRIDALATFERVRTRNPVPYAALLQFGATSIISASPERFVRIDAAGIAESKPIKGTRPRDVSPGVDRALRDALSTSEKERAENLMIVDLVRNDLSRVCTPGSVSVPSLFGVESYAFVHQLVSTVRGALRPGVHPVDAVRALFPAGSMTGAPKVRTMAILDRIENRARGVYSGALGYFSLTGEVDLSVVIRTMVATDAGVRIGVGGAITALSDPVEEYAEILVKAASSLDALCRSARPVPTSV